MNDPRSVQPFAVPSNLGKRLLLVLCGLVAFATLPVTFLALAIAAYFSIDQGPGVFLELLQVLPYAAIGGGAVFVGVRIRRELDAERELAAQDALRAEARARRLGTLASHARQVAGPSPAEPPTQSAPPKTVAGRRLVSPGAAPGRAPVSQPPEGGPFPEAPGIEAVRCTWCGTKVSVALGDPSTGDATCPACTTTFSMRLEMHKTMGMRPKPPTLKVVSRLGTLTIVHPTTPGAGCAPTMIAGVALLLTVPDALNTRTWIPTAVAGVVFVAVVVLGRLWASRRTEYDVSERSVAVRITGFMGRVIGTWDAQQVDQVFLRERVRTRSTRNQLTNRRERITERTWDVILREKNQAETRLAKDLRSLDVGLYLEQEIENRLGVVDRPVDGGPGR